MKAETYFKKYNKVYGVSYSYRYGWRCYCIEFTNFADALSWLNTEQYEFRIRELLSKTDVISCWGKGVYNNRIKR